MASSTGGRWGRAFLAVLVAVPAALPAAAAEPSAAPRPARPPRRSTVGKVLGWVLDARTRRPIPGARVSVLGTDLTPADARATAVADETGRYLARAPLGRVSSKLDWGRVLTMHPVSLLLSPRSITKQTKIVDVTGVTLRVEAEGYRPFTGRVRVGQVDPGAFTVTLNDVWLASSREPLVSFTPGPQRLEVIDGLRVEPPIAAPGETVRVTLATRLPLQRGYRYRAYLTSTALRLVDAQVELKREKVGDDPDRAVFSREVTLPKTPVDRWTELGFFLVRDEETELRQKDTRALLQVVRTPGDRSAAERIAAGFRLQLRGEYRAALEEYRAARAAAPGYDLAHLFFGDLALRSGRTAEAAEAYRALVALSPMDFDQARSRYATALLESGSVEEALAQLAAAESTFGKDRVPPRVALARARAFAQQRNFAEVDRWLAKAGKDRQIPDETLAEINIRRMAAAVEAEPESAELRLGFARLLDGAGRREAAAEQYREAIRISPDQPWGWIDLGATLQELGHPGQAVATLRRALELAPDNPEAVFTLAETLREQRRYAEALPLYARVVRLQEMNLRARQHHALLLYATGKTAEARAELSEVVKQALEKGDLLEEGLALPGFALYFGPKRRLVAGYSEPEAAAAAELFEALLDLEQHPGAPLAWQELGSALIDLQLPDLALSPLEKSLSLDAAQVETRYLYGIASARTGNTARALRELQAVVKANPLHPRAHLELASLFTLRGELDQAQLQLAAHARAYPFQRVSRPVAAAGGLQ